MVQWYTTPFPQYAGDPFAQAFRITTRPDEESPTEPEDLSAYTDWACQWRSEADSATAIDLTVDATDAAIGVIVVRGTGEQVRAMAGPGVFDFQAIGTDGEPRTFVRAKTTWKNDVTR